jgi:hypothetical protein
MTAVAKYNFISSDGTTSNFRVGTEVNVKGCEFGYFLAGGVIAAYNGVTVDTSGTALAGTTTTAGARPAQVAIPQFDVASGEYFWAPIGPFSGNVPYGDGSTPFKVLAAASCAKDVKLYTTATAGVIDDAATTLIEGLVLSETITTARAASCVAVKRLSVNG